jgi:hypothetical protein
MICQRCGHDDAFETLCWTCACIEKAEKDCNVTAELTRLNARVAELEAGIRRSILAARSECVDRYRGTADYREFYSILTAMVGEVKNE